MTVKTIRHAIWTWVDSDGSNRTAFHGQTVDVASEVELARGEAEGAFFDEVGQEAPRSGTLQPLAGDATDEQLKAYLASGTAPEILGQATAYSQDQVARLAQPEYQRKGSRSQLVSDLRRLGGVSGAFEELQADKTDVEKIVDRLNGEETSEPTPEDDPGDGDDESGPDGAGTDESEGDQPTDDLSWVNHQSIDEVLAEVGSDTGLAAKVRAVEETGKARKGLLGALDEILAENSTPDGE